MTDWRKIKNDTQLYDRMKKRADIIFGMRKFFRELDFLEIETPTMVQYPGMEPNLDIFETEIRKIDGSIVKAGLITSPEYSCKKLLAAGYEKIFEITRCYRNNEPWTGTHNPEFTMIEWYRANADYTQIMSDTERLVSYLTTEVLDKINLTYQGNKLDVAQPWIRLSVAEAFDKYVGIDLDRGIEDLAWFAQIAKSKGYEVRPTDSFEDIFFRIFLTDIERKLGFDRPVILFDYPKQMASLAKIKPTNNKYAERFEIYICGVELCNAFSELNNGTEQKNRLKAEQQERKQLNKPIFAIDEDFVSAVGAMPDSAGIALGVDRLVMLLTDAPSLKEVMFFSAQDLFAGE